MRLFASAVLALWITDVVVNLGLANKVFRANEELAPWADFIGLFQAQIPIALAILAAAFPLAPVLRRLFRGSSTEREALALTGAALVALSILGGGFTAWRLSASKVGVAGGLAGVAGVVAWLVLRAMLGRRDSDPGAVLPWVALPPLLVGLANRVVARTAQGNWEPALFNAAWLVALIVVALARPSSPGLRIVQRSAPLVLALGLVISAGVSSARYGRAPGGANGRAGDRPDVVLIVLDTVRADHLQRYGHFRDTMPELERWGQNALTVKRAVSPGGWTSPSHASMFSGLGVSAHGIHYRAEPGALRTTPLPGIEWLPEKLAEAGYECLAISANKQAIAPEVTGFDRKLFPIRHQWHRGTTAALVELYSPVANPISERTRWRRPFADAKDIVDIAERALPENPGPTFLFLNFIDAHAPYNPPRAALRQLGIERPISFPLYQHHRYLTRRWESLPEDRARNLTDLYDGELRWIDMNLPRLFAWIDERLGKDTVVIVTSDHGEELGEDGRVGHEFGLGQSLVHVPLFVRSEGIEPGELDEIVSLVNVYDFILAAAAGERPGADRLTRSDERVVVSERYPSGENIRSLGPEYGRPWVAFFEGGTKAVGPSRYGFELLDVASGGFHREIPVDEAEVRRAFEERIDAYWEKSRDRRDELGAGTLSAEDEENLRALGYID